MSRFNLLKLSAPWPMLIACALLEHGCAERAPSSPVIAVTIAPLAALVGPIAEGRADVATLLPAGASPHTYELTPSDARRVAKAHVVFYVDDSLDGWAARLGAKEYVSTLSLVPAAGQMRYGVGDTAALDPHFWLDPVIAAETSLAISTRLISLDIEYSDVYFRNALKRIQELTALHEELAETLAPIRGATVVQHHPSMNYFFARYGIRSVGSIELSAGREPTPRELQRLAETMRVENTHAIITEPQLPRAEVDVLAELSGARVVVMDPLGGVPGRSSYEELLRYNAQALLEGLS